MECFKRFRNIDSHFANKQILKDFERSNHRRVNIWNQLNTFTLFLAVQTPILLNLSSSLTTATLPLEAAICAQVEPSYKRIIEKI